MEMEFFEESLERIREINPNAVLVDGFDNCIIGISERYGEEPVLIYSREKIIDNLMKNGCNQEDALEYYYYNILGSYVNESMPIFMI